MKKITFIALVLVFISGCTLHAPLPEHQSGFLSAQHKFRPNPKNDDSWVSTTQHFSLKQLKSYDKIAIAPVELWLENNQPYQITDSQKHQALTQYFEQQIQSQLAANKTIVPVGTKDSLLVKIAITNLSEKVPELEVLDVLPFRIVTNAGKSAYLILTDQKIVIGKAGLEAELLDANTGNSLAAVILDSKTDEMYVLDEPSNIDSIKAIIENWVDRLANSLRHV